MSFVDFIMQMRIARELQENSETNDKYSFRKEYSDGDDTEPELDDCPDNI